MRRQAQLRHLIMSAFVGHDEPERVAGRDAGREWLLGSLQNRKLGLFWDYLSYKQDVSRRSYYISPLT